MESSEPPAAVDPLTARGDDGDDGDEEYNPMPNKSLSGRKVRRRNSNRDVCVAHLWFLNFLSRSSVCFDSFLFKTYSLGVLLITIKSILT
jgi:hypothetical protein